MEEFTHEFMKPDLDGAPEMLMAALQAYEHGKRGTGRTTRMIDGLDPMTRSVILCVPGSDFQEVERQLKARSIQSARALAAVSFVDAGLRLRSYSFERLYLSHMFCHEFFKNRMQVAKAECLGFAHYWAKQNDAPIKQGDTVRRQPFRFA
jgi:hypothetical protein